jgi:hypothetical protein
VRRTANLSTRAVCWSRTDIARDAGGQPRNLPLNWHGTWARAHEPMASFAYQRADRLAILDLDAPVDPDAARAKLRAVPAPTPAPARPAKPTSHADAARRRRYVRQGGSLSLA